MKEKELRLAFVFYGGVSLAIYQHGVNLEILNLIRASQAYHAPRNIRNKQDPSHRYDNFIATDGAASTEAVYFDILKALGSYVDLRVVVDIISGSSAGGINGVTLGCAVAHDLDLSPLTRLWLDQADILYLLAPEARARSWSKWYIWPFTRLLFRGMAREGLLPPETSAAMRSRMSTFIRSRWFKPPLDGKRFLDLLLDGFEAMHEGKRGYATLLPPECTLDLFLSVTDYRGIGRPIFIHDPEIIYESEHKRLFHFAAKRTPDGRVASDLDSGSIPALAFACRASASYPGAFPPARIADLDKRLEETGRTWPGRADFLGSNLSAELEAGIDPTQVVFLDGSILNNRPVQAAIQAISKHYAYREVDRRLVYVDPHPKPPTAEADHQIPGFFSTIRRALSDLPRTSPIYDDLESISRYNELAERLQEIVDLSRPHVLALIEQATQGALGDVLTAAQLAHLRLTSTNVLSRMALVYDPWVRALVNEGIDVIAEMIAEQCGQKKFSRQAGWIRDVIEVWCRDNGILINNYLIPDSVMKDADLPRFGKFIVDYSMPYKRRRIYLIINRLNGLYREIDTEGFCTTSPDDLDQVKRGLSECLEEIDGAMDKARSSEGFHDAANRLFAVENVNSLPDPAYYAGVMSDDISALLDILRKSFCLIDPNERLDEILSSPVVNGMGVNCRRELRSGFVGFPYWDIVLLPAMNAMYDFKSGAYSFSRILVDRISPVDGHSFAKLARSRALQGASIIGFGGFVSRKARENDFLWGRLNGVERLIDILESSIADTEVRSRLDFPAFKKQAFRIVLDEEEGKLTSIKDVFADIRGELSDATSP